ncbi:hypothetical protein FisN_24Lh199 [Fistulifera solaris]|uniref:Methyltransferase small domain-containing protein n=1 Tax=Fistulifera solaris TaxID=1519565 RepID=A0A1Z5K9F1_FISSO|nr:hypothetical protein FisN_24Lh199 [Fistulifera solaris]|eukprot:GAX22913.1 hypothetical protein FisN_24Lh199 [Fistulifera solaris]
MLVWTFLVVFGCLLICNSSVILPQSSLSYARQVRCLQGHDAAAPLYQSQLEHNPYDGTTATRLAASPWAVQRLQQIGHFPDTEMIRTLLQEANYTSAAVNAVLGTHRACPCPVYIKPAMAGQTNWTITHEKLTTPVSVLVALLLLGLAVPRASLPDEQQWLKTGIVVPCDFDPSLVIAYASLYPFDLPTGETLYFVTDWHPHVLSTTRFVENEEPVMYLGPDSLALAQHFILTLEDKVEQWLDLCTGSGIQAILTVKRQLCQHVICVDVNPRALRLAAFNARLNQIEDAQITFLQKDLLQDDRLEGNYQVITANPPFLPVPPDIPVHRHGWFSSGGPSGDAVVQAILHQAPHLLEQGGKLAMVSEFFATNGVYTPTTSFGRALLFTNAVPLSVTEYARRRADSAQEYRIWCDHLADYDRMSPGLLFLHHIPRKLWKHVLVPASSQGSLWTPGNTNAIQFTRECSQQYLGWFRSYR